MHSGPHPALSGDLAEFQGELSIAIEFENQGDFSHLLSLAVQAAQKAGVYLVTQMGNADVKEKNPGDFVTQADFESQRIIFDLVSSKFPTHGFLGEEDDNSADTNPDSEYTWIVDPIDGTNNFIHQLPSFSVSIGLRYQGKLIVGCVHDPILGETYTAITGQGAALNGQPITASRATGTHGSISICSLPRHLTRDSYELHQLNNVLCDSDTTVRRLGSAALNLCYIAAGRADAYWTTLAQIWDIAGGALILTEAGGVISDINGNDLDWDNIQLIACGTDELRQQMVSLLAVER